MPARAGGQDVIPLRSILTEGAVLAVFFVGIIVSRRFNRRWTGGELVVMYFIGLLFEVMTSYMWQYHHIFLILPTPIDSDISVLFPLGWAGMLMITTTLAEAMWARWKVARWWSRHLVLMAVWLVVGDVAETAFYNIGMIEYVREPRTEINFVLGQLPGLPPTLVLATYPIIQPLGSIFLRWLERGLRAEHVTRRGRRSWA